MADDTQEYTISRKPLHRKRNISEESEDEAGERKRLMANCQERVRMQRINVALEDLKQALPEEYHPCRRRMSKIRTLQSAMDYINGLSDLLKEDNARRRHMYLQAKEYVYAMCADPWASTNQHDYSALQGTDINTFQTPNPYYPYLGPLCQTPTEQTPSKQILVNPRHLNFDAPAKRMPPTEVVVTPSDETIIAGKIDSDVVPPPHFQFRSCDATPLLYRHRHRRPSRASETFPSPFVGTRNDHELDDSLAIPGDNVPHDMGDVARDTCSRAKII